MADQTPPHDPLGDRLRATFAAERDDLERRHLAGGAAPARGRSLRWIPFAVAAAVIAIAGFVFIGNRSNDQAVELDVAGQTIDDQAPETPVPTGTPVPGDGSQSAISVEADPSLAVPYVRGENRCGSVYNPNRTTVQGPQGNPAPAHAQPQIGSVVSPTRTFPIGSRVELAGGCTAVSFGVRRLEFYEIAGQDSGETEWIRSDYLVQTPPTGVEPEVFSPNECGTPVPTFTHFVWGIGSDDPDGGLVAHTSAAVDAPVTRVIPPNTLVGPTRGCVVTENGSTWLEIFGYGSPEWVNARYLKLAQPACLVGGQYGTLTRDGEDPGEEPFFHTVMPGDLLSSIAEQYNVTVDVIIRANPEMDPNLIIAGSLLRIPGASSVTLVTGPRDGVAVADGDKTAFAANGASPYRWFPSTGIEVGTGCFTTEQTRQALCISGEFELLDTESFMPMWAGTSPQTIWATGRSTTAAQGAAAPELLEINVVTSDGRNLDGFFDPVQTDFTVGHCVVQGNDRLADAPCTRVAGADRTAGLGTNEANRSWSAGDARSTADHVHDIRTESNDDCTRIVVEFGENANLGATDVASATLPPVVVDHQLRSVRISADGWQWESAFDDATRIDYPGGIGLFALSLNYEFAVDLMHRDMEPHIRFLSNPARVVIDLFPFEFADPTNTGPFGERFVLTQPIQLDPTGQGIPVDNDIIVEGFGRPFEAAGLYRIWAVPDDVDPDTFFADPPTPLIQEFFPTGGSADGWGRFFVPLPDLASGSYIAVFGELPPTDEIGFYGTGQLFRVTDSPGEEPGTWPEAVLLPNVQLPPE